MKFTDLKTTKKGRIGERIVCELLEKWRWRYKEAPNRSHLVEFVAETSRGERVAVEVKTYPRRAFKFDTGIDAADFEKYSNMRMDVILIFIDQFERCIYGQRLSNLQSGLHHKGKVYFRLDKMRLIRWLTVSELRQLSKHKISACYEGRERYFMKHRVKAG